MAMAIDGGQYRNVPRSLSGDVRRDRTAAGDTHTHTQTSVLVQCPPVPTTFSTSRKPWVNMEARTSEYDHKAAEKWTWTGSFYQQLSQRVLPLNSIHGCRHSQHVCY